MWSSRMTRSIVHEQTVVWPLATETVAEPFATWEDDWNSFARRVKCNIEHLLRGTVTDFKERNQNTCIAKMLPFYCYYSPAAFRYAAYKCVLIKGKTEVITLLDNVSEADTILFKQRPSFFVTLHFYETWRH